MDNKERFISLCSQINREGMDELMSWLENSDFYKAPASTKYHNSFEGGLLEHSLNVYDELKRLLQIYTEVQVSEESIIISSLFHDLCKVNFYTVEKRNRKNESGHWETYDSYTINEKFCFGGHGSKSLYLLNHFIKVTTDEAVAINCHMGLSDEGNYIGKAFEQFPFAWLVSVADQAATFIKESNKV